MNKFWSQQVNALHPYIPGEQPQDQGYIKLNTNENPYPPSTAVEQVIRNFDVDELRRYPDPESTRLVESLASYHGLASSQVFIGNGSDEVLAHAFQGFFQQSQPILFADISYSFYPVYCALYQIEYSQIPLDAKFRIRCEDYRRSNGGIIIANPNAPTGIALGLGEIRNLLEANPDSVVIIDEAYVDFGTESASRLIAQYANLVVIQTFSKSRSLAGLRLGYALAQEHLIEALQRIKNSFNSYPIDRLSGEIALAALADEAYFQQCRSKVIATREILARDLQKLGFEVFPSSSNFLFIRHLGAQAESLYLDLKSAGILVRYFNAARIDNCLRISIGTDAQCTALVQALRGILQA